MDDNFKDYFTDPHETPQADQPHVETPEEREAREIKESTIERRHNTVRWVLILLITALVLFLCWWCRQRFFVPSSQSVEKGWIMKVENKGAIFKTFEAQMVTEGYVQDTVIAYHSDFNFTIDNDSLATEAVKWQGDGRRVTVYYDEYKASLPWRGESRYLVRRIELDSLRPSTMPRTVK